MHLELVTPQREGGIISLSSNYPFFFFFCSLIFGTPQCFGTHLRRQKAKEETLDLHSALGVLFSAVGVIRTADMLKRRDGIGEFGCGSCPCYGRY